MLKSSCKSLIVSFEKIAVLTLVLSLMGVQAALAASGGVPGPPHVTPPRPRPVFRRDSWRKCKTTPALVATPVLSATLAR